MIHQIIDLWEKKGKKPPVKLIELGNCFTNPMMIDTLQQVLSPFTADQKFILDAELVRRHPGFDQLVQVCNVDLRKGEYPPVEEDCIYIVGGSDADVYDPQGEAFVYGLMIPLLEHMQQHQRGRLLASCFGHQSAMKACAAIGDIPLLFQAQKGAFQFGLFPIRVSDSSHPALSPITSKTISTVFTRSGYVDIPGSRIQGLVNALAFESDGRMFQEGGGEIFNERRDLPPVICSLLNGDGITIQPHLEVQASNPRHQQQLRRYLGRYGNQISSTLSNHHYSHRYNHPEFHHLANTIMGHNIGIEGTNRHGKKVHWVQNEPGPAVFTAALNTFAQDLL